MAVTRRKQQIGTYSKRHGSFEVRGKSPDFEGKSPELNYSHGGPDAVTIFKDRRKGPGDRRPQKAPESFFDVRKTTFTKGKGNKKRRIPAISMLKEDFERAFPGPEKRPTVLKVSTTRIIFEEKRK